MTWSGPFGPTEGLGSALGLKRTAGPRGQGRMPGCLSIEQSREPILPVGMFFEMLVNIVRLSPKVLS